MDFFIAAYMHGFKRCGPMIKYSVFPENINISSEDYWMSCWCEMCSFTNTIIYTRCLLFIVVPVPTVWEEDRV